MCVSVCVFFGGWKGKGVYPIIPLLFKTPRPGFCLVFVWILLEVGRTFVKMGGAKTP